MHGEIKRGCILVVVSVCSSNSNVGEEMVKIGLGSEDLWRCRGLFAMVEVIGMYCLHNRRKVEVEMVKRPEVVVDRRR